MPDNITKKTWAEFRKCGMLWLINTFLHLQGWVIVVSTDDETGEVVDIFPARTKYRGFTEADNDEGFKAVHKYLKEHIVEIEAQTNE